MTIEMIFRVKIKVFNDSTTKKSHVMKMVGLVAGGLWLLSFRRKISRLGRRRTVKSKRRVQSDQGIFGVELCLHLCELLSILNRDCMGSKIDFQLVYSTDVRMQKRFG